MQPLSRQLIDNSDKVHCPDLGLFMCRTIGSLVPQIATCNPPPHDEFLLSSTDLLSWFDPNYLSAWFGSIITDVGKPNTITDVGKPENGYLNPGVLGTRFPAARRYHFPKDCNCRYDDRYVQFREKETGQMVDARKIPNDGKGAKNCPYHTYIYLWKLRYAVTAETTIRPVSIAGYSTREEYDKERKAATMSPESGFGAFIGSTNESGIMVLSEIPYLKRMVPVEVDVGLDVVESFCMTFVSDISYRQVYPPWEQIRVPRGAMEEPEDSDADYEYVERESRFEIIMSDTKLRVWEVFNRMGRHRLMESEIQDYRDAAHNRPIGKGW